MTENVKHVEVLRDLIDYAESGKVAEPHWIPRMRELLTALQREAAGGGEDAAWRKPTVDVERERFKAHYRKQFDLTEIDSAWGAPRFIHEHVESIFYGWRARAELTTEGARVTDEMVDAAFAVWRQNVITGDLTNKECLREAITAALKRAEKGEGNG